MRTEGPEITPRKASKHRAIKVGARRQEISGELAFDLGFHIANNDQNAVWRISPDVARWGAKVNRTVAAEHRRMEAESCLRCRGQTHLPVQPALLVGRRKVREACRTLPPALFGARRQSTLLALSSTTLTMRITFYRRPGDAQDAHYRSASPWGFDLRGRQLNGALDNTRGEDVWLVATRRPLHHTQPAD